MRYARFGAVVVLIVAVTACSQSPTGTPGPSGTSGGSGPPGGSVSPDQSDAAGKPSSEPQIPPPPDGAGEFNGAVVTRTGGIIGLMQQLVIAPDGGWVYTDERSGASQQGKLTSAQRQQLLGVLANPALAAEAAKGSTGGCADAFSYTIAVENLTIQYEQCEDPSQRPVTEQLLALLVDATPL